MSLGKAGVSPAASRGTESHRDPGWPRTWLRWSWLRSTRYCCGSSSASSPLISATTRVTLSSAKKNWESRRGSERCGKSRGMMVIPHLHVLLQRDPKSPIPTVPEGSDLTDPQTPTRAGTWDLPRQPWLRPGSAALPTTRASVSPGAEQDEQAQPHPGSFGTDPRLAVNTGKGPPESPPLLPPAPPRGTPTAPLSARDHRSPWITPTGVVRGLRRCRAQEGGPGATPPVSPWVGGAIGGGQRAAWRVPQLCRRPAPRARRSPTGRVGTGHRPGGGSERCPPSPGTGTTRPLLDGPVLCDGKGEGASAVGRDGFHRRLFFPVSIPASNSRLHPRLSSPGSSPRSPTFRGQGHPSASHSPRAFPE